MTQNMVFAVKFVIMVLIPDVPANINLSMKRVSGAHHTVRTRNCGIF